MRIPILAFLFILLSVQLSKADSWLPPETTDYFSEDSTYVLTIVPTKIPNKYYDYLFSKPNKKRKFSSADTTIIHCYAILYKTNSNGREKIWEKQLINEIAPTYAIISNDGEYTITFDNWHSVGYGLDVMVVYDKNGNLQKRYKLEEISPFSINDYMMSVSSLWWRENVVFLTNSSIEITYSDRDNQLKKRVYNLDELSFED